MEPVSFNWVDSSVLSEIDTIFSSTFGTERDQKVQLKRLRRPAERDDEPGFFPDFWSKDISSNKEIKAYAKCHDSYQIIHISQKNAFSRLFITRQLFDEILRAYSVFSRIWDFVVPFSFKTKESDIANAPFRFRELGSGMMSDAKTGSFECAYGFRYVQLNHEESLRMENPDWDPWSLRHSAIYQQYNSHYDRVMFMLISPSENARKILEDSIQRASAKKKKLNAFDLHRIIISPLHENWRLYIRSLENLVTKQSELATLAMVHDKTEKLSPLTDFAVNFVDRQRLKMIEDKILDLAITFDSLYNTLSQLQKQCQRHCLGKLCVDCTCSNTIDEFEEQMQEVQVNIKKMDVLHKRCQGVAQLLSDLFDYENAQITHFNGKALVTETRRSNANTSSVIHLKRCVAAVKVLIVITLLYFPMILVANIFSSQLVHVDEHGNVTVVSGAWWFAVIAVPLTLLSFGLLKFWLRRRAALRKPRSASLDDTV